MIIVQRDLCSVYQSFGLLMRQGFVFYELTANTSLPYFKLLTYYSQQVCICVWLAAADANTTNTEVSPNQVYAMHPHPASAYNDVRMDLS